MGVDHQNENLRKMVYHFSANMMWKQLLYQNKIYYLVKFYISHGVRLHSSVYAKSLTRKICFSHLICVESDISIIDPEHVEINTISKPPLSTLNKELSNILNIDAISKMSYLVCSMQHISKFIFVVLIGEALTEYSNCYNMLLIEILIKFILIMPCFVV